METFVKFNYGRSQIIKVNHPEMSWDELEIALRAIFPTVKDITKVDSSSAKSTLEITVPELSDGEKYEPATENLEDFFMELIGGTAYMVGVVIAVPIVIVEGIFGVFCEALDFIFGE